MKRILFFGFAVLFITLVSTCTPPSENQDQDETEVDNPDNPENPDGPDNPENPENPDAYFKMVSGYNGSEMTDVLVFNHRGECIYYLIDVETNVKDWTVEGGSDWCRISYYAVGKGGQINLFVEPYNDPMYSALYPRTCTMTVKAPGLADRTFTIGQESENTYIYTAPNQQTEFTLPASGAAVEVTVITNLVDWKVVNDTDWVKTEIVNRYTLRLSVIPADSPKQRQGKITLMSVANGLSTSYDLPWELTIKEGSPDVTGDDYIYDEGYQWENN